MFITTDNGASWTAVNNGLTDTDVNAFAASGTSVFAGTWGGGVFLTTDNGANWMKVNNGLTDTYINALAVIGTNLFAGTLFSGVFLTTDNGANWTAVNSSLSEACVSAFAVSGENLFAGTWYEGVWRRPLSEMVTSVEMISGDLPKRFSLSQNYPNPFNPVTTISFTLPSKSFVSLKIFDSVGREVAVLVSRELPAGNHSRRWIARGLSSGVYFCRLQAGSFAETKKLLLIR